MRFLLRAALIVVPREWRSTLASDFEDEAGAGRHRLFWQIAHIVAAGLRLRCSIEGSRMLTDLRYALRSVLGSRGFAIGAMLTFAFGIGVNVAVFSTIDRMFFRPLPYAAPDRLFVLRETAVGTKAGFSTLPALYVTDALARHVGIESAATAAFVGVGYTRRTPDGEEPMRFTSVSHNMLDVLGVRPQMGRGFLPEDAAAKRRIVLLSDAAWQRRFGRAADVLGRTLWGGQEPIAIAGVLPPDFIPPMTLGTARSDGLWLDVDAFVAPTVTSRLFAPIVRLEPGIAPSVVEDRLRAIKADVPARLPPARQTAPATELRLEPIRRALFGRFSDYMSLVVVAAGTILVLTGVNLAGLFLARGRSRELAASMQLALGATPGRLIRTAIMETGVIAAGGTLAAMLVLTWSWAAWQQFVPTVFSRYASTPYDVRVLGFAIGAAVLSTVLAGVLPAIRLSRLDLRPMLTSSKSNRRGRLRGGASLLTIEAALGIVLVSTAALTARSLLTLTQTDFGFDRRQAFDVLIFLDTPPEPEARLTAYRRALDVLRAFPGVSVAGGANDAFLGGSAGYESIGKGYQGQGIRTGVTGGYFEALGMPALAGRLLADSDVNITASVGVLNRSAAALLFPGKPEASLVGAPLIFEGEAPREIVGVVADVRGGFGQRPTPTLYVPVDARRMKFLQFYARTAGDGRISASDLRERVTLAVARPRTVSVTSVDAELGPGLGDQQFRALLFSAFAAAGLLLVTVGLYALGSFDVSNRVREFAIRAALGASPSAVAALILRQTVVPVLAGIAIGIGLSVWAGRFLQQFLYQVDARDPGTLALVAGLMLSVSVVTGAIPARRAARTDAVAALKQE